MELAIPSAPTMDFDFGSSRSSPVINYSTAPSSPKRSGHCFFSAPTSPSRMSQQFDDVSMAMEKSRSRRYGPVSAIPFHWEETPGTPKSVTDTSDGFDFDFAFDVSVESEKSSISAEELFDGGKIRPLKPPPRLQFSGLDDLASPRSPTMCSPRSPIAQGKKYFRDVLSPRRKKESDPDPFSVAANNAVKETEQDRGRGRKEDCSGSKWRRRVTRSLSPFRVWEFQWEEETQQHQQDEDQKQSVKQSWSFSNKKASWFAADSKGYSKKWSFRKFLLFRSRSDGSASDNDSSKSRVLWFRNRRM